MREIDATTAADYLRDAGWIPNDAEVLVRELSGGVSNTVLRVDLPGKPPFVLKQCRERLRVPMEWRARLDRIWTEHATLEVLRAILPERVVPEILFEDRRNYLFAMTCAPDDAVTWKTHLMAGRVDPTVATRLGTILGTIHAEAPAHPALRGTLSDTSLFDELRVDPYYRTIARAHRDLAPRIDALIDLMDRPEDERTLVLGDFSPKNILVHSGGLILLDFECAHAGDPAFDLGFFLTHLVLKAVRAALRNSNSDRGSEYLDLARLFWSSYLARRNLNLEARSELNGLAQFREGEPPCEPNANPARTEPRTPRIAKSHLVPRAILHTAACCLARVDGKSPVEYLDVQGQAVARSFARELLQSEAATWDHVLKILDNAIVRGMACQP